MNRREFIKIAGFITGTAVGTSCSKEKQLFIPYIVPPEKEIVPGELVYYPTTCTACPANCGVYGRVVEKVYRSSRVPMPVKLEGNPFHPINEGKLCIRGQASITSLYSYYEEETGDLFDRLFSKVTGQGKWHFPGKTSRLTSPLVKTESGDFIKISWQDALEKIADKIKSSDKKNYFLSSRTTGTLSELIDIFSDKLKIERTPEFEPYSHSALREGNKILFNYKSIPFYRINQSDLLITLGADILETFLSPVSYSLQISRAKSMGEFRWIHIEPHLSLTGLSSTERIVINAGSESLLLLYILKFFKGRHSSLSQLPDTSVEKVSEITGIRKETIDFLINSIKSAKKPLIIAGGVSTESEFGAETAVLAGMLQFVAGGKQLIDFSMEENYSNVGSLNDLLKFGERLNSEGAGLIFIHNVNPIPFVPDGNEFKEGLEKVDLKVGLSEFMNDTIRECDVVLPLSDCLESWGDAEPRLGIRSLIQPLTEPLFGTLSSGDILLEILRRTRNLNLAKNYQEFLFRRWHEEGGDKYFENIIKDGFVIEKRDVKPLRLNESAITSVLKRLKSPEEIKKPVLIVTPSLRTFDGRDKHNILLNEVPDPLSAVSYGEFIAVSENDARRGGFGDGDLVKIKLNQESITLPVKVQPGLSENVFTIHSEYVKGTYLNQITPYGDANSQIFGIVLEKTGGKKKLPVLSGSMYQDSRGIIPEPNHREHTEGQGPRTLYPEPHHNDYRWAMAIDLELCSGCSACVAACYIENNIPVVGEKLHLDGRELSWIRLEPYFDNEKKPVIVPMLCQQCSYAPCESVCPVYATYHNPEGLNAQVYNRCVGTRYCSNNCPYKVRRFNWFNFKLKGVRALQYNPDVLVRPRGVMEKCTFCIQRIRRAKDNAKDEGRKVREGEVIPACAQTCPMGAITFGNILDKESKVYKLATSERAYRIFEQLGTEPAVYYLKKEEKKRL